MTTLTATPARRSIMTSFQLKLDSPPRMSVLYGPAKADNPASREPRRRDPFVAPDVHRLAAAPIGSRLKLRHLHDSF
jgi:hypothetical protein